MIWKSRANKILAQTSDYFTILSIIFFSSILWEKFFTRIGTSQTPSFFNYEFIASSLIIPFIFIFLFNYFRAYNYQRFTSLLTESTIVFKVVLFGALFSISIFYLFRFNSIPRAYIFFNIILILFGLIVEKTFMFYLARIVRNNQPLKRIILVGESATLIKLQTQLMAQRTLGLHILGTVIPDNEDKSILNDMTVLGHYNNISQILKDHNPEEVIICQGSNDVKQIQYISEECEKIGIQIRLISDFFTHFAKNISIDTVQGITLISFYPFHRTNIEKLLKRSIDVLFSIIMLILLSPLFLVIIVLILIQDGLPIFFKWKVMGFNRKPIVSWKFRTMYTNADEKKDELLQFNEMKGPMFKMENDPRIYPVGRFLRKYSLDELPQLFSVLKGDLSLVGPRPPLQYEFKEFDLWHRRKLCIKPGITCLWQISGRNNIDNFDDWVRLDLEYIDNWSLLLDIKILFKTIPAVLKGTGK